MARHVKEKSNLNAQLSRIRQCELLSQEEIKNTCSKAAEIFLKEPNIVRVDPPVAICGDIHGQFYDVLELFLISGEIPETNYLFLGDYVDRGYHSIETLLLLLTLKLLYPKKITLIRGNHEARSITQVYGFYDECLSKFGSAKVWQYCTDLFDTLPIAAIVGDRILGIHGGLSPEIHTLDEIRVLERRQEVPHQGPMCDLMWSDPDDCSGWNNSPRGAGYLFGGDITQHFVQANGLEFVVRAHQLVMEGYKWHFNKTLLTIWSAPNYCYRCGNLAAVLELNEHMRKTFITFEEAPASERQNMPQRLTDYFM